jgi:succinate dehydrogenase/fumarate reductase flavoprotein subunit
MSQLKKEMTVDVLVLGGGPAGAWSAWSAASQGAKVVLADKGYLGTSGATAPGGTTLLVIPPIAELREQAVQARLKAGGYLSENAWIHRVLDQVEQNLAQVEQWGYPFPKDGEGNDSGCPRAWRRSCWGVVGMECSLARCKGSPGG